MIYINYSISSQEIVVPVSVTPLDGEPFYLSLKGQVNLTYDSTLTAAVVSPGNHFVKLTVPSVEDLEFGSYEYILYQSTADVNDDFSDDFGNSTATILSKGVAVVGNFNNDDQEYDTEITYKQYEG